MSVTTFRDQMLMSDGVAASVSVEAILLDAVPGATSVRRATPAEDRSGVDWWVDRGNGHAVAVDLKARSTDPLVAHGADDLALEVWSVVAGGVRKHGWTLDANKRADYILWLWMDTGRWSLVPFAMLCAVFRENCGQWTATYREWVQTSERWQSSCIFVPRKVVWRAIFERFSGQVAA